MIRKQLWVYFILISQSLFAQIGGGNSFNFLEQTPNAKTAALGGLNVAASHGDINAFANNPALLDSSMHQALSLNIAPHYAGITNTSLSYARNMDKIGGMWGFHLQYMNYGKFDETDVSGNVIGSFSASDFVFALSHSHQVGIFRMGGSIKFVASQIGTFNANALAMDIGGVFVHPEKDLQIGLSFKNMGFSLKDFSGEKVTLPFDAQVGVAFKPAFMPLRFSVNLHHLHQFELAYDNPDNHNANLFGVEQDNKVTFLGQLFRHMVIGTELLIHKNFQLRFGYNRYIGAELKEENAGGMTGFSGGLCFKVKSFELHYARATYHAVGASNYITLSSNLNRLLKKKI